MDGQIEHEICGNCKKEIPQHNYVMHTAHCARNFTLCQVCKEPIPKSQVGEHKNCQPPKQKSRKPELPPPTTLEKSAYYQERKSVEDKKAEARRERQMQKYERLVDTGYSMKSEKKVSAVSPAKEEQRKVPGEGGVKTKSSTGLMPCRFCELELPKTELEEHENYCGTRTDKCLECGELVMYKYKQIHMDTNHGFLKLKDEPGPRPSWDSTTQRSSTNGISPNHRPSLSPLRPFAGVDSTVYSFPTTYSGPPPTIHREKGESYKEISRRLDCKTEYIRNLLQDSASITVPLRHNGAVPRNHFNHNKGNTEDIRSTTTTAMPQRRKAAVPRHDLNHDEGKTEDIRSPTTTAMPQRPKEVIPRYYLNNDEDKTEDIHSPVSTAVPLRHNGATPRHPSNNKGPAPEVPRRRRNPPTELTIPCEFCNVPIPHEDLIQHETGCRPDLARFNPKRRSSPEPDDYFIAPQPSSPEVELPCEFCADMIPASQLLRHQATCI